MSHLSSNNLAYSKAIQSLFGFPPATFHILRKPSKEDYSVEIPALRIMAEQSA